jgi:hypothetical protein
MKAQFPDITSVPADLSVPEVVRGAPAAGRRVRASAIGFERTNVYHTLYLPSDWQPGGRYPVIAEYAGNGNYRNEYGDESTGMVEGSRLGYGISAGKGIIWVCLPFVDAERGENAIRWWGDVESTVDYCQSAIRHTCDTFGGDEERVILAGFSRGAIACNYIGLHDDRIARLWRGFIAYSHYDGVREWDYPHSDRASAAKRLARLGDRPQFICQEESIDASRDYLAEACPGGNFTFQVVPFRNHTDAWVLRENPAREALRRWFADILGVAGPE